MEKTYISYKCKCGKEFVLLNEDAKIQEKLNRYISCPFCNSRKIKKERIADTVKECMRSRSYKRVNGAIREKI